MTQYWKTIVAAMSAFGIIVTQAATSTASGWALTVEDATVVLFAALGVFGAWLAPNSPASGKVLGRRRKT